MLKLLYNKTFGNLQGCSSEEDECYLPKKNNNISDLNEKINNVNLSSSSDLKGKSLNEELIDDSDDEEFLIDSEDIAFQ